MALYGCSIYFSLLHNSLFPTWLLYLSALFFFSVILLHSIFHLLLKNQTLTSFPSVFLHPFWAFSPTMPIQRNSSGLCVLCFRNCFVWTSIILFFQLRNLLLSSLFSTEGFVDFRTVDHFLVNYIWVTVVANSRGGFSLNDRVSAVYDHGILEGFLRFWAETVVSDKTKRRNSVFVWCREKSNCWFQSCRGRSVDFGDLFAFVLHGVKKVFDKDKFYCFGVLWANRVGRRRYSTHGDTSM